jgi:glucosylceramidase
MMSQRALKILSVAVCAGSVVAACGGDDSETTPAETTCVADGFCDVACAADPDCPSGTGGVGNAGTGGVVAAGGTGGAPLGGTGAVPPTGGMGAALTGGSGGVPTGGTAGTTGGGGAVPTGGTAGTTGGAGGVPTGGTAGTGGSGAAPTGGTAATGGSGAAPTGGVGAGGTATGGAPPAPPPLVTSASGAYWVTTGTLTEVSGGTPTVTVDENTTAQTWEGFSGAFNEMGWEYLSMLSAADRERALQLLFGVDGCRFPIARIPIGASDYAMDRYTLDEVPDGSTDPTMASFSIARDEERLIPFIKAAQAIRPDLRFWASPWTPPTWMKEGPFNTSSPFDGGSIKGDTETLAALAQYFVLFVQGYAGHGIDIEMVAPQNEPGYSGGYPTCAWAPDAYRDFVGLHLGPALESAGLGDVGIMLGTFNGGTGDTDIVSTVMGDATANGYIDAFGFQWSTRSMAEDAKQHSRPIWQSEHQCGNYPWVTDTFVEDVAPNDHAYAVESWGLMRDWIETGVNAYATWNLVLDTEGVSIDTTRRWPQNALLTVDTSSGTLNLTPTYYVFRHFSQFVEPGATVIGTSGGDALAFRNPDGTIVTVMYNSGGPTTYTLAVGGQNLQFEMPGDGWATVVQ